MKELKKEDVKGFRNFLRIGYELQLEILQRIEGQITKQDTSYKHSLSPGLKLAISSCWFVIFCIISAVFFFYCSSYSLF